MPWLGAAVGGSAGAIAGIQPATPRQVTMASIAVLKAAGLMDKHTAGITAGDDRSRGVSDGASRGMADAGRGGSPLRQLACCRPFLDRNRCDNDIDWQDAPLALLGPPRPIF